MSSPPSSSLERALALLKDAEMKGSVRLQLMDYIGRAMQQMSRLEYENESWKQALDDTPPRPLPNPFRTRETQGRRERPEALKDEGRGSLRKRQAPVSESEGGPSKRRQTSSPDPSPVKPSYQDFATARPAPIPNPFLAAPVPAPTRPIPSPSQPTLASTSSRHNPLFKLFAETDNHSRSTAVPASPGPRAANREARSYVNKAGAGPRHVAFSLPAHDPSGSPTSSVDVQVDPTEFGRHLPAVQTGPTPRKLASAFPIAGSFYALGAAPTTTTTAAPPAHLVAAPVSSAAPVRRNPLGPSTAQAATAISAWDRVEGVLYEKVKGVLSTDERKSFRQLLKAHDHSASVTKGADLVQGLHTLFLHELSLRTPVSMDAKDREKRRKVLEKVKVCLGLK